MRLSQHECAVVKSQVQSIFGQEAQVFLFGSRVDDLKKGGDIDLFIKISDQSDLFNKKIRFLARVKKCLGEQKIDVVFNQNDQRLIEKEIQKWAIPL
ncbi:MAG: nucleotidyltransferase domain-containing protein [Methylococcales bacterium]|jgi:predicted nucleotidyltransferase|nr:nucleotidyltransferase domain-containing protein [Methylococcales bacterium]